MNKTPDTMTRDEVRSAIALKVLAHVEAPRELNLYSDFFTAPTSTRAGRKNNFAVWTRGCAPELVAELRALCDRLDALDAASEAAAALGRMGGASTSPAKRAASRANGAKGGRPEKPAGEPHVWTMREVAAVMGDRSYTAPAGRGVFVRAACFPGEDADAPAFFDVSPSWADSIGPHDDCDATIAAIVRRIEAKFPSPNGWEYRADNGTIDQVATFPMPGFAPVAGVWNALQSRRDGVGHDCAPRAVLALLGAS